MEISRNCELVTRIPRYDPGLFWIRGSMGNDLKTSIVLVALGAGAAACRRRFQTTAFYSTTST